MTKKAKWRAKAEQTVELPAELNAHRVLLTRQAATFTGYEERHWRKLRRQGLTPPAIELSSKRIGWIVGDLIAWLQSKKVPPGKEAA
jgi:predicted DNA-binding transcriptional regulator AlpA